MATFRDKDGRDWVVTINIGQAKRVRSELGTDILDIGPGGFLEKMADPITICDVLFVLCREQCAKREMSDEDFGAMLVGDTIQAAVDCFIESLISFFPSQRQMLLRAIVQKGKAAEDKALSLALEKIEAMDLNMPTTTTAGKLESGDGRPSNSEAAEVCGKPYGGLPGLSE